MSSRGTGGSSNVVLGRLTVRLSNSINLSSNCAKYWGLSSMFAIAATTQVAVNVFVFTHFPFSERVRGIPATDRRSEDSDSG